MHAALRRSGGGGQLWRLTGPGEAKHACIGIKKIMLINLLFSVTVEPVESWNPHGGPEKCLNRTLKGTQEAGHSDCALQFQTSWLTSLIASA